MLATAIAFTFVALLALLEILSHTFEPQSIVLAIFYLLWGILFALKSPLSTYAYWLALVVGSIANNQSEYFIIFSILVFR